MVIEVVKPHMPASAQYTTDQMKSTGDNGNSTRDSCFTAQVPETERRASFGATESKVNPRLESSETVEASGQTTGHSTGECTAIRNVTPEERSADVESPADGELDVRTVTDHPPIIKDAEPMQVHPVGAAAQSGSSRNFKAATQTCPPVAPLVADADFSHLNR